MEVMVCWGGGYYCGMSGVNGGFWVCVCVCVIGRSGLASSCVATGPLTVALALALIQKHRRSCVGRRAESEVASRVCRLLHLSLFFW